MIIVVFCFFFNDTATTEIYTLSLHDALPICSRTVLTSVVSSEAVSRVGETKVVFRRVPSTRTSAPLSKLVPSTVRSEEHTSELQSRQYLVCRLLLEKKKKKNKDLYLNRVLLL